MAYTRKGTFDAPEVVKKTKIETTYEYVPIIGEVLGFWRKADEQRLGETIEVHLNHTLGAYDRILVNGEEIALPKAPSALNDSLM